MRMVCARHGFSHGVLVSSDIKCAFKEGRALPLYRRYSYELGGEIVDEYVVTSEFAARNKIESQMEPLPDEYPAWSNQLAAC